MSPARPDSTRLPSPQRPRLFLSDGGLETTMIFREGLDLPCFASFTLLRDERGVEALRRYYSSFLEIARRHKLGFALDTPTWRTNRDWGERLGYSPAALADVNREAVAFAEQLRAEWETRETPVAICGTLGPRDDAYAPAEEMGADAAEGYHAEQIGTFADTAADMVGAYTLAYADKVQRWALLGKLALAAKPATLG